ncbi:central glycolytic genes regulator [Enterococcus sp. PF1-24]|uniref:sugar-binding transcriptional regulator n=1 Tax=unclassified Enterococcus TaxID=2608891 RepID=UPI00247598C6|nr:MULTISPECIES: sugar-binding domain-containing protein [unclassified Enterococcus]MDH6364633.1 central glycolytic genes regulator [Enterococcus sp. PFB1-1]MDH6401734.1 central glycolytic genes regulator [Enterococcus sp. PF1-24]
MLNELKLVEALVPELVETLQERFQILKAVYWLQPIGRRSLAENLEMTERMLRTETDFLRQLGLLTSAKSGMSLTSKGKEIFHSLEKIMNQLSGMDDLEHQIANHFGIERCLVIEGDSDLHVEVVSEFGEVLNNMLDLVLPEGQNIIAVMGGTTMAEIANHFSNLESSKRHNVFVPARGGIGEALTVQANTVSAVMAGNSGGEHRALYVPEQLSEETYQTLLQEPAIDDVLELINHANCVIHSIGRALHMAARRKMNEEQLVMLKQQNAVAESFGYFFDEAGEVIYKVPRIGLQLEALQKVPHIFAVAGGKTKAKAIRAYLEHAPKQTWLITDEAAANEILKGVTL